MIISLIAVTFSPLSFLSSAQAQSQTRVDVHCHIFNAKDVPLVGVLKHFLKDTPLDPVTTELTTELVIALANEYYLSDTPGYVEENEKLNELLLAGPQNFQCPPLLDTKFFAVQN